jgi:hypothetical protein
MGWNGGGTVLTVAESRELNDLQSKGVMCRAGNWDFGFGHDRRHYTGVYVGQTYCTPVTNGNRIYVWLGNNTASVYDYDGNKELARNYLTSGRRDAARQRLLIRQAGDLIWKNDYGDFHAGIVPHGDRLYIRSKDYLICIAPQKK